jgi:diadenosine tetraphosphate (Ap4A) HIT family hydrolase
MDNCRFCDRVSTCDFDFSNDHAVAFPDSYPLSAGHTLVIPRVHEADLFELDVATRAGMWQLVDPIQSHLAETLTPDVFNIGVNVRPAAGHTIPHADVHVIPRTAGDVADPRGGVRWVIPNKAPYWEQH